ncbi:MAG: AAA family ATPase [Bacilli bacterium]
MEKYLANSLNQFYGQKHLVGKQGVLSKLIDKNTMKSCIFYGPSGTGKTTLAKIICNSLDIKFGLINAAIHNKQKLVDLIDLSNNYERFLIIIDEIHRMNKDKQDILLPHLEKENIIVIGLTTLNPYHSLNPAIRSRMHIFEFTPLTSDDIKKRLHQIANDFFNEFNIEPEVYDLIISSANGDMRSTINQLDILTLICDSNFITKETFKLLQPKKSLLIDKNSDYYYDLLSAFQKSLRGSDVDASLHYLAHLIALGDLEIICRRLLVITYEDVGLANPNLHHKIYTAICCAREVGFPEAVHPLANAVIEIALSPKSNTAYMSIKEAISDTKKNYEMEIPINIKHYNEGYLYPHDYNGWVNQQYLPNDLINKSYVKFKNNKHEKSLEIFYKNIQKLK